MDQRVEWLPPVSPTPPPWEQEVEPPRTPPEQRRSGLRRALGPLAVLAALAVKFKGVFLLLPKIKLLTTSGSMLVSVAAYALLWPWSFAVGLVLLLLVHEMGHVIQLRREGIKASAPMFIPFMGALVAMKELPKDAVAEARVGLAGPVLGSLGAALLVPIWLATGDEFWRALAFVGFFLNLVNLVPVLPLDGGRAMAAMAPAMWLVGLAAMVGIAVVFPSPIILLVLVFGGIETWRRWKARRAGEEGAYYQVKPAHRLLIGAVYIGLIVALGIGAGLTHLERDFGDA